MVKLCLVIILSTTLLVHYATADGCPSLPISHFQWLNPDGSILNPQASYDDETLRSGSDKCCGSQCSGKCKPLPDYPGCKLCSINSTLICLGNNVPNPAVLTNASLALYKVSQFGLISLPRKCFSGLSIQILIIENSNISFFALDTFSGVKSIVSLYMRNNKIDYIPQADYLFQNIKDLKFLSLEGSKLKVLSSTGSANMHNLTYFSLAGNPLYTMDVYFLQNSKLTYLDLRNITFKLENKKIKGSGLSKLPSSLNTIDLSRAMITNGAIEKLMEQMKGKNIETLNLGYLQTRFRSFYALRHIKNSLQYLSLRGTDLSHIFNSMTTKVKTSKHERFFKMKELDLGFCNISFIESGLLSRTFPNLEILSMARNPFSTLDLTFFSHMSELTYTDLSSNIISDIVHHDNTINEPRNLQGADLSNTYLDFDTGKSKMLFDTLKNIQMLSLCQSTLSLPVSYALNNLNNLKYLDLSAALTHPEQEPTFRDLILKNNISLRELHFSQNNYKLPSDNSFYFSELTSLETLNVSNNLIRQLSNAMLAPTLNALDASQNLITTWYFSILNNESQLQYLDVSNNQITYVSEAMIGDFYKLDSLVLDSNPLICHNKVVALVCLNFKNNSQNVESETQGLKNTNQIIQDDSKVIRNNSHTLTLVDWKQYRCYDLFSNGFRQFSQEKDCNEYYEEVSTTHNPTHPTTQYIKTTSKASGFLPPAHKSVWDWEWTYFIVGPFVLVSALGGIVYLKWWNIKCFFHHYISLKKARLLLKNGSLLSKPEVYYDVFVSYSDVDRAWVLDHLVPNMEKYGDISLCFHERDFQVGMSILENIIDCMDRSHALLLVVSSAFIYSKWCQFEMHLAQNRLIETFRDQLVLVLLEDIPRKARPQTLHHLMMTKTYLMWPQQDSKDDAYQLFWRRLKRALRTNLNSVPV